MRGRDENGTALVEFVWLGLLLMVPLVYVVLTAGSVQRTAFGVTDAVREAGRAYATAGSDRLGQRRAAAAIALVLHDDGVVWSPTRRPVTCGLCDYSPGSGFTVAVRTRVKVPLLPAWLCRHVCVAGITISARHSERISCYSGTGPPAPGAGC